ADPGSESDVMRDLLAVFHRYVCPVYPPAARMASSGLKASATVPYAPAAPGLARIWGERAVPRERSQRYALPLVSPVASGLPSGLNATAWTSPLAESVRVAWGAPEVPDLRPQR